MHTRQIIAMALLVLLGITGYIAAQDKKELLIVGTTLDLSRGLRTQGDAVLHGLKTVFSRASIPGLELKLDERDDDYSPEKALANVENFIKEHTEILLMPLGSATFKAYFDLVKQGKIMALFPSPGIQESRNKDVRYCINLRPSYEDETSALVRYVLQHLKPKKVLLFYQDDAFGRACLSAAQKIFSAAAVEMVLINYPRNDLNFHEQIKKLKATDVDAIGLFVTTAAAKELFKKLGDNYLHTKQFFAVSDVGQLIVQKMIQDKVKIIVSNVVPNPEKSDIPLVKEFREQVHEHDTFALEAYLAASLLVDVLSKIAKPVTNEKIIDALEKMHQTTIKGFPIDFNKEKRQLSNRIWINNGNDAWLEIIM